MSTLKVNQWLNLDGTENYKTRAWVNFNGTGTVAIRASGNVSSITDNGVGDYTINFATALANANYSVLLGGIMFGGTSRDFTYSVHGDSTTGATTKTATAVRVASGRPTQNTASDSYEFYVGIIL